MQEKNGWVTESNDPNHHFPVMTIEEHWEHFRTTPYRPSRDEYPRDREGNEYKTSEEYLVYLMKLSNYNRDLFDYETIPERFRPAIRKILGHASPW
jgi:hypothetical protein